MYLEVQFIIVYIKKMFKVGPVLMYDITPVRWCFDTKNIIFVDFIYTILFYSAELTNVKVNAYSLCTGLLQAMAPGCWGSQISEQSAH